MLFINEGREHTPDDYYSKVQVEMVIVILLKEKKDSRPKHSYISIIRFN